MKFNAIDTHGAIAAQSARVERIQKASREADAILNPESGVVYDSAIKPFFEASAHANELAIAMKHLGMAYVERDRDAAAFWLNEVHGMLGATLMWVRTADFTEDLGFAAIVRNMARG